MSSDRKLFVADVLNWRFQVFVPVKASGKLSAYVPTERQFYGFKQSDGYVFRSPGGPPNNAIRAIADPRGRCRASVAPDQNVYDKRNVSTRGRRGMFASMNWAEDMLVAALEFDRLLPVSCAFQWFLDTPRAAS